MKEKLYEIIKDVWESEDMPEEWTEGIIVPVYKKGSMVDPNNYRGITLLNAAYKVLTTLIQQELIKYTTDIVGEYQYGFRQGSSTTGALHVMNQICEKSYEYDIPLHFLFVDYKQAFDSIKRVKLYQEMNSMGIPQKLIKLTRMTMENSRGYVRLNEGPTEKFQTNKGVRQGDALSATLFNIAMESVIRKADCKGTIRTRQQQIIAYADDIVIIARTKEALTQTFTAMEKAANSIGLKTNSTKTKYMRLQRNTKLQGSKIKIGEHEFEEVSAFNYLGMQINNKMDRAEVVEQRIQQGYRAFYANKRILKQKKISRNTKFKIYKTLIRPVITYAGETMCLSMQEEEKLRIFERKVMRTIMGPKIEEGIPRQRMNHELMEAIQGGDIVQQIKSQRIRWVGHVMRANKEKDIRAMLEWKPLNTRAKGRPKIRWREQVAKDIEEMGIANWKQKALNREEWKEIVGRALSQNK